MFGLYTVCDILKPHQMLILSSNFEENKTSLKKTKATENQPSYISIVDKI